MEKTEQTSHDTLLGNMRTKYLRQKYFGDVKTELPLQHIFICCPRKKSIEITVSTNQLAIIGRFFV